MKQKKAYKYRMYPTDEQAHILARTFGCCRYVYNWALRARTDAFFQRGERLYYNQLAIMLTELKKQESPLVRVGVPWVYPWGGCQLRMVKGICLVGLCRAKKVPLLVMNGLRGGDNHCAHPAIDALNPLKKLLFPKRMSWPQDQMRRVS